MNSACPNCRKTLDLSSFSSSVHDYMIGLNNYSEITYKGRCGQCRKGVVFSYRPFCDKMFSWTELFELGSVKPEWIDLVKGKKYCLYLCRKKDETVLDLIFAFWLLHKGECFFVARESDFDSIRTCRLSYMPLVIFPDSLFFYDDLINMPSILAERVLLSFFKNPSCVEAVYHNDFEVFSI